MPAFIISSINRPIRTSPAHSAEVPRPCPACRVSGIASCLLLRESDDCRRATRDAPRLLLRSDLPAEALLLLAELGRELSTEVLRLEHLANLDLGLLAGEGIRAA